MSERHDHFDRYFAEKIWALIPEYYREEDGLASPPGVLRGFVEVLAQQAATLRRSTDRLWDDEFIDLCADWAVPYLGELVATRMVSALNVRARRVDKAYEARAEAVRNRKRDRPGAQYPLVPGNSCGLRPALPCRAHEPAG